MWDYEQSSAPLKWSLITGSECSALLPSKDSAYEQKGRRLKIAIDKSNSLDSQPESFTPREGLDEASAKVLHSQLAKSGDEAEDVVWYKNKEVQKAASAVHYIQILKCSGPLSSSLND